MDHRFRIATLGDGEAVSRLLRASYTTLLQGAYPAEILDRVLPKIVVAQEALLASGRYFMADDGRGAVIAAGGWTEAAPGGGPVTPGLGHVRHVAVDPGRAGQGLGTALMARLFEDARAGGMTRLEVWSTLNARAFYAACGFSDRGEIGVPMGEGAELPSIRMIATL